MSERRNSRLGSSASLIGHADRLASQKESQEILHRLRAENRSLRQQLEDAQEELVGKAVTEGRSLIKSSEESWAAEIDTMTKEEVRSLFDRFTFVIRCSSVTFYLKI